MNLNHTSLIILSSVVFLSACSASNTSDSNTVINKNVEETPVIATVNGEEVDRLFYQKNLLAARKNALMQSRDPFDSAVDTEIREEVLNQMIQNVVLAQTAEEIEVQVSTVEVDDQFKQIVEQYGGEEKLVAELTANGSSIDELKEDVLRSKRTQKYIEDFTSALAIEVTDEDIQSTYDEAAAANKEVPPLDDVREQIKQQLESQKKQEALQTHLDELTKKAAIVRL